jgi:hypothetical protein
MRAFCDGRVFVAAPQSPPGFVSPLPCTPHCSFRFADGGSYKGEWQEGMPHGQGTSISPNGDRYTGEFCDGLPNGHGDHQFANGERYVGEYKYGKQHGAYAFRARLFF